MRKKNYFRPVIEVIHAASPPLLLDASGLEQGGNASVSGSPELESKEGMISDDEEYGDPWKVGYDSPW